MTEFNDEMPELLRAILVFGVAICIGSAIGGAFAWVIFDPVQHLIRLSGFEPRYSLHEWISRGSLIGALVFAALVVVKTVVALRFLKSHQPPTIFAKLRRIK